MIGAIEQKILDRLKAASAAGVLGYKFLEVESLPIDIDESLAERVQRFPSAWTAFQGWKAVKVVGDGSVQVEATYHVVVAAQNVRNERSTRMGGSASEVGSYQMTFDVARLMAGQTFGLQVDPIEVGDCGSLFTGLDPAKRKVSLFSVELKTGFLVEPTPDGDLVDFNVLHVNWDIPPHGGIDADPDAEGVQLPDDEHADATSHIIVNPEA